MTFTIPTEIMAQAKAVFATVKNQWPGCVADKPASGARRRLSLPQPSKVPTRQGCPRADRRGVFHLIFGFKP